MTDLDKYVEATKTGLEILRQYGNWSVPPWIIKKFGFENVETDLRMRAGKQYRLREITYRLNGTRTTKNTYYIFEVAK